MSNTEYARAFSAANSARRVGHTVSLIGRVLMALSVIAGIAYAILMVAYFSSRGNAVRIALGVGIAIGGTMVNLLLFGVLAAVGANTRSNASKVLYDLSMSGSSTTSGNPITGPVTTVSPPHVFIAPAPTGTNVAQTPAPPAAPRPTISVPPPPPF